MKTSELTGAALDWAVANAVGYPKITINQFKRRVEIAVETSTGGEDYYSPSTDWSQGGPIIERECIAIHRDMRFAETIWVAGIPFNQNLSGPTPLIAAMRCFAASNLGDEVEIPEELL